MAYVPSTTPPLARRNPTWTPATGDLGLLAPFFGRGSSAAPVVARPRPVRPAPAMEMADA